MLENIKSGEDYANILIEAVLENESKLPEDQKMDSELFSVWSEIVFEESNKKWIDYITGKNETFLFSDEEFTETFKMSTKRLVSNTLIKLFDNGMVNMSVGEDGEILYGLTEEGKKEAEKNNNN